MQRISMSLWREPSSSTPYTMVLLNARLGVSLTLLACFAALTSAQAPAMSPTAATSTESGVTLMIDPWVNRRYVCTCR